MDTITVIVSTYQQPNSLGCSLRSLSYQSHREFELVVADDGSDQRTRSLVENFARTSRQAVKHVWHEDLGFRKTRILNRAIIEATGDYLVFLDGDCVAHPDLVREHVRNAKQGFYLNGSRIMLGRRLSDRVDHNAIVSGNAFRATWLIRQGRSLDRRYLRLALGYGVRCRLNRYSPTRLYWLGSHSSCFREDAVAVNGFDHRFGYGFEDGDFGSRLERFGLQAKTVRWTANLLHLWHPRPWFDPQVYAAGRRMMADTLESKRYRAVRGLDELRAGLGKNRASNSVRRKLRSF